MRQIVAVLFILVILLVSGCQNLSHNPVAAKDMNELNISDDFNFPASREVLIRLTVLTSSNEPVSKVHFSFYTTDPETGGDLLGSGITNTDGILSTKLVLSSAQKSIVAEGYMSRTVIPITNGLGEYVIGGSKGRSDISKTAMPAPKDPLAYLTAFNNRGTPIGMLHDDIPPSFMSRIASVLPERQSVPVNHPEFVTLQDQLNVKLNAVADVFVTYVGEGAATCNSLGFYTYNSATPPANAASLAHRTIIFPNASGLGAGGELLPGDKLKIGTFPANTTIGWFLVADGWAGNGVGNGLATYYSNRNLNPEAVNLQQHSIQVWDPGYQKLVLGFEDRNRSAGNCDHDFNDLLFYVTVTPHSSTDMDDIPILDDPDDRDHDGIPDDEDDYPDDPDRAFDNYTPSQNCYASLAFEDLWPAKGDFDFNDMVLDYNINQITNAQGKVKEIKTRYYLRAMGAIYKNGFAFELPFAANKIQSVTANYPAVLEADGSKAVIRLFDSGFSLIPKPSNEFINTVPSQIYHTPVLLTCSIIMTNGMCPDPLNFDHQPPYNPFLTQREVRAHEIHLPNYAPTSKADVSLFNTVDDNSIPAQNRYYKTRKNQPWVLNIPFQFDYPQEKKMITWGYLHFQDWVESNGTTNNDWFMNMPGYRNDAFIYPHH